MVTFIKLYINKTKLKKDNPDINLNDINEQFYVSNYESYNRLNNPTDEDQEYSIGYIQK